MDQFREELSWAEYAAKCQEGQSSESMLCVSQNYEGEALKFLVLPQPHVWPAFGDKVKQGDVPAKNVLAVRQKQIDVHRLIQTVDFLERGKHAAVRSRWDR